ncbi:glycosyltransferase family A protein [Thioalkalivibrio sp. AKL19]|uniref:glycosyltransferase family 2 protein n=1 Tax=Thioalkalivibrio sp. AKL19 TaxID=1266914 RepID=UPI0018CB9127|nr:glycosyltransferase family A protein [Thioalkalivibrio sp. AKL19]
MSITVVVTCFNEERFIEQALLSVLNQSRLDLVDKIFVVDDESTDCSLEIIREIQSLDDRVEVIWQKNAGLAVARNNALQKVTSDWVCFLDGDDIWPVDKIEKQVMQVDLDPEVSLVYTDSYRFGNEERYIRARTLPQSGDGALLDYFCNDAPILSSVMVRTSIFSKVGVFDPELRVAQDTEMWTRAVSICKIAHVKEALLFRRMHSSSLGYNFEKKSQYLDLVTDKIVHQFPQLEPYRYMKDAMVRFEYARRSIHSKSRVMALKQVLAGLRINPRCIHGYAVFLIAIVPFSDALLRFSSKVRMGLSGAGQAARIPVPHYGREATRKKLKEGEV